MIEELSLIQIKKIDGILQVKCWLDYMRTHNAGVLEYNSAKQTELTFIGDKEL